MGFGAGERHPHPAARRCPPSGPPATNPRKHQRPARRAEGSAPLAAMARTLRCAQRAVAQPLAAFLGSYFLSRAIRALATTAAAPLPGCHACQRQLEVCQKSPPWPTCDETRCLVSWHCAGERLFESIKCRNVTIDRHPRCRARYHHGRSGVRMAKSHCAKWLSKVKAAGTLSRSITAKLVASVREKSWPS